MQSEASDRRPVVCVHGVAAAQYVVSRVGLTSSHHQIQFIGSFAEQTRLVVCASFERYSSRDQSQ